nr:MAG TPA: hypothetical protein [Bacteriophage sp.]
MKIGIFMINLLLLNFKIKIFYFDLVFYYKRFNQNF